MNVALCQQLLHSRFSFSFRKTICDNTISLVGLLNEGHFGEMASVLISEVTRFSEVIFRGSINIFIQNLLCILMEIKTIILIMSI